MTEIIKVTASGDFNAKSSWNGIQKHLEHDPNLQHENDHLNTEESKRLRKFNRVVDVVDYDKWTQKHFEKYVLEHDRKNLDKGRFCFGSVKNFLRVDAHGKARTRTLDKLYMMKFSDEKTYHKIVDRITNSLIEKGTDKDEANYQALNMFADSFADYLHGFNQRNKYLVVFEGAIHLDEEGSSHVHGRVMPFVPAKNKQGQIDETLKPYWSLNKALREQYGHSDTRDNLKDYRKQEDQAMIDSVNKTLEKEMPEVAKEIHFELTRLNPDVTGLKHEVYRERAHLKDLQEQAKEIKKARSWKLDKREEKLDKREQLLQKQQEKIEQRNKELDEKTNKLVDYESSLNVRSQNLDSREKKLDHKSDDLNDYEQKLTEYKDQIKEKAQRYNGIVATSRKQFAEKNKEIEKKNKEADTRLEQTKLLNDELTTQLTAVKKLKNDLNERIKKFERKAKNVAQNWRNFAFNLCNRVYQKSCKYFSYDVDPNSNDAYDELAFYDKNIDKMPYDFDYSDWEKHQNDKQFNWLRDHKNRDSYYNKTVSNAEKTIQKRKELTRKGKDKNNDGIDDSQENFLKTIDIADIDPLLDLNNKEEQQNQAENEKNSAPE